MTNEPFVARTGPFCYLPLINVFSRYFNHARDFLSSYFIEFRANKPTFAHCSFGAKMAEFSLFRRHVCGI